MPEERKQAREDIIFNFIFYHTILWIQKTNEELKKTKEIKSEAKKVSSYI